MQQKEIGTTTVYEWNRNSTATTVIDVGGAGSSKSHSIAQLLIEKLVQEEGKAIGICRKTFPALRMTAMKLVIDLLKEYGIYNPGSHNKTSGTYSYNPTDTETGRKRWAKDSTIQFFSVGD
ncbi:hypothetical protein LCGC14_2412800, partial [marine sediment metagenome]